MKHEALLIIDMLHDFVRLGAPLEVPDTRAVIPVIRREIDRVRSEGMPILYVLCDSHAPDDKECYGRENREIRNCCVQKSRINEAWSQRGCRGNGRIKTSDTKLTFREIAFYSRIR